jgi:Sulfotransferase family
MEKKRKIRYNMTISCKKKYIWFRVAKVATRSLLAYFSEYGECLIKEGFHSPIDLSDADDFYKFAFTRNPYDRLVSCWLDKVCNKNKFNLNPIAYQIYKRSFSAFVKFHIAKKNLNFSNAHFRRQSVLLPEKGLDFIGHIETLEQDFNHVIDVLKLSKHELLKKNETQNRKDWRFYYTPSIKRLVADLYSDDFERFGYDKEIN